MSMIKHYRYDFCMGVFMGCFMKAHTGSTLSGVLVAVIWTVLSMIFNRP